MTIYSKRALYSNYIQEEASRAFGAGLISEDTNKNIRHAYRSNFYIPNYFIRFALGTLTLVTIIFSALLLGLMFNFSIQGGLLLFFALINYLALELLVNSKKYYNAGVDNLLMCSTVVFLTGSIMINDFAYQNLVASLIALITCLFIAIKFTDRFMAVAAYIAFIVFMFLLYTRLESIAKATAPFLIMVVSAGVYFAANKLSDHKKLLFHCKSLKTVMFFAMLSFYAAGNYFVVKELSNSMFQLHLTLHDTIPFGWLFWLFTVFVPIAYIIYGTAKQDIVFIRTGLLLVAATVFTFRYYYTVAPVEIVMLTSGAILIAVMYAITKYLRVSRAGFSFYKPKHLPRQQKALENLIITQVAGQHQSVEKGVEFGGGSFGGAGSGGNF